MNEHEINNVNAEKYVESIENTVYDDFQHNDKQDTTNYIGKAQSFVNNTRPIIADIGWKAIPLELLPSKGIFYNNNTEIAIRAASVSEIRHWSTIDEDDLLSMDDMINYIIEKCVRLKTQGVISNWKDIKEIDRLYILFAIREYTFKDGENKIYVNSEDGDKIEVRKEMLSYFNLDEKIMDKYNLDEKCFIFQLKDSQELFKIYMPSIGVTSFIKNYVRGKQQQGINVDASFIKFASFLFNDYRTLTTQSYDKALHDSSMWSLSKLSAMTGLVDMITQGVDPKVTYTSNGGMELTAPLNFLGGIKSIFIISDFFNELV